jgi:hypothetical protein
LAQADPLGIEPFHQLSIDWDAPVSLLANHSHIPTPDQRRVNVDSLAYSAEQLGQFDRVTRAVIRERNPLRGAIGFASRGQELHFSLVEFVLSPYLLPVEAEGINQPIPDSPVVLLTLEDIFRCLAVGQCQVFSVGVDGPVGLLPAEHFKALSFGNEVIG